MNGFPKAEVDDSLWLRLTRLVKSRAPNIGPKRSVGTNPTAHFWLIEAETAEPHAVFQGARIAKFSPAGNLLAVGYEDRVEIWDFPIRKSSAPALVLSGVSFFLILAVTKFSSWPRRPKS